MSSDALRKAFEAWLNPGKHAGNVSAWVAPGRYEKDTHQLAWLAWCAALSAPVPAPAEPPPSDPLYDDAYLRGVALGLPQGDSRRWTLCRIADRIEAAAAAAPAAPAGWQPIETAPQTGRKIIVAYVNRNGKPRTVMARWLTDEQAAETDADGVGLEGGWYECIDNWDDYTEVAIHEGEPTHWAPLPAAPGAPQGDAAHNVRAKRGA